MLPSRTSRFWTLCSTGVAATVLLSACSSDDGEARQAAAVEPFDEQPGAAAADPQLDTATAENSDESPMVGGPADLTRLPFGIVNNLETTIYVAVSDVDPYDWTTGGSVGTPRDNPDKGFDGLVIGAGKSATAWFEPKVNASGAPFRLSFLIPGASATTPMKPLTEISFDKMYICERIESGQVDCMTGLSRRHFKGWTYRTGNNGLVENQFPQTCDRTSAPFSYTSKFGEGFEAQGRLDCASSATGGLGTAIVLENIG